MLIVIIQVWPPIPFGDPMTPDVKDVIVANIPSVLPTLMVLFGIMSNKNDINYVRNEIASMRGEISHVRSDLHTEIVNVRTELRSEISGVRAEVASIRTELRADISGVRTELGAFKTQAHTDIMTLVGLNNDVDKRVSRLENKS